MTDTVDEDPLVQRFIDACHTALNRPGCTDKSPVRVRDLRAVLVALGEFLSDIDRSYQEARGDAASAMAGWDQILARLEAENLQ